MNSKPVIGINTDFRPEKKDAYAFAWIHKGFFDSITDAGGLPVVIPPLINDADLKQAVSLLDGLVLTGCKLDLDPVRLGLDRHPVTRPMPVRREDFDRRLAQLAYQKKIPTLAVGAGMQTMNVICGGTLFQHIPEDILKPLHHRDPVENGLRHIIEIVPGTRLDMIYGPGEIRVNSDHHMAVDQLAAPFKVCATACDGVIEAYETIDDNWYCMGVQWHPESETASALDLQVFEAFVAACKESGTVSIPMSERRVAA